MIPNSVMEGNTSPLGIVSGKVFCIKISQIKYVELHTVATKSSFRWITIIVWQSWPLAVIAYWKKKDKSQISHHHNLLLHRNVTRTFTVISDREKICWGRFPPKGLFFFFETAIPPSLYQQTGSVNTMPSGKCCRVY